MAQNVRARYDYDPFGNVTKVFGDKDSVFLYTGHFWHAQSGLYLTLFRAYDANLGRWLSRDPLGEYAGPNLYAYIGGNPINFIDSLGLCDEKAKFSYWGCMAACEGDAFIRAVATNALTIYAPPGVSTGYSIADTLAGGFSPIQAAAGYSDFAPGFQKPNGTTLSGFINGRINDTTGALVKWGIGKPGQIGNIAASNFAKYSKNIIKGTIGIGYVFSLIQAYRDSEACSIKCASMELAEIAK